MWIGASVDCLKGNSPNKPVRVVVIILLPLLGSILYFLLGKSKAWPGRNVVESARKQRMPPQFRSCWIRVHPQVPREKRLTLSPPWAH
jgi:hypothetical protein